MSSSERAHFNYISVSSYQEAPKTEIQMWFLQDFKHRGMDPKFIGTDKDGAQMAAISRLFPECRACLCMWHLNKNVSDHAALGRNATSTEPQSTPSIYFRNPPPFSEIASICWTREDPDEPCGCGANSLSCGRRGNRARNRKMNQKDKETLSHIMFSQSLNIPGRPRFTDGETLIYDSENLFNAHVNETFTFCVEKNYFEMWMYLWSN